ncbi:MAG: hypothetical protein AABW80_02375 [Nanoarchaeota archaeon]
MKIEVNVRKRYFFTAVSVLLILSVIGIGVAYNANQQGGIPAVFGHSADEVEITLPDGTVTNLSTAISTGKIITSSTGAESGTTAQAFTNQLVYDVAGTYQWKVPAGVSKIRVKVWGAGGGASGSYSAFAGGASHGGGSGGYAEKVITPVSVGTTYDFIVGAGGVAGNYGANPVYGIDGGMSWFGSTSFKATGGFGGNNQATGVAAQGGMGSGGDINLVGGTGGTSTSVNGAVAGDTVDGVPGVAGGTEITGSAGSICPTECGKKGTIYSMGGSTGARGDTSGNGADGRVVIEYSFS